MDGATISMEENTRKLILSVKYLQVTPVYYGLIERSFDISSTFWLENFLTQSIARLAIKLQETEDGDKSY